VVAVTSWPAGNPIVENMKEADPLELVVTRLTPRNISVTDREPSGDARTDQIATPALPTVRVGDPFPEITFRAPSAVPPSVLAGPDGHSGIGISQRLAARLVGSDEVAHHEIGDGSVEVDAGGGVSRNHIVFKDVVPTGILDSIAIGIATVPDASVPR
jgi:hypothetical protein